MSFINPESDPSRKQEDVLWEYFELSSIPLKVVSPEAELVRYNDAFGELLGYQPGEVIERMRVEQLVHEEDIERTRRIFEEIFAGQTSRAEFEVRMIRKDGSIAWAQEIAVPEQDLGIGPSDTPTFAIVVSIDVSMRKEMERRIEQSERMRSIGQLSGSVAHDFNNILTVLNFYTELLRVGLESSPREELMETVEKLQRGIEQGVNLARQLTEFGQDTADSEETVDVNAHLREANSLLSRYLNETFEIHLQLEAGTPPICIVSGKLDQIILNLAVNARDAMPEGGELHIRTFQRTLHERDALVHPNLEAGEYVVLQFSDSGVGIPAEVQRYIFEPFYTTRGSSGGTGLGLATVYGIMEQLGGTIYVDSEVGQGTTFTMYFPAARPDSEAAEQAPSLDTRLNILLVEGQPELCRAHRQLLESENRRVIEAGNLRRAQHEIEQLDHRIDLLIADLKLPDGSGEELAEQLSRQFPDLSVLFINGVGRSNGDARALKNCDKWECLPPSIPDKELLAAAIRSLEKARKTP